MKNILTPWRSVYRFYYGAASEVIVSGMKKPETNIVLPTQIGNNPVRIIDKNAFADNCVLMSITIPRNIEEIKESAFRNCQNLKQVTIENNKAVIADSAFVGCKSLADKDGFVVVSGVLFEYFGRAEHIIVPEGVRRISPYAFRYNERSHEVKSITLPRSITHLTRESLHYCPNLKDIYIK